MASFLVAGGNEKTRLEKIQEIYQKFKPANFQNDPDTILYEGPNLGIEEIRNLKHRLSLKPYNAPPKIAIIFKAQNLTFEAQGALLKLLEEPPGETIIILACPTLELILPTVISRCQVKSLPAVSQINLSSEDLRNSQAELEKILKLSLGQRIKWAEKIKGREETEQFCQTQLVLWREMLLKNPNKEISEVLREIQKTLKYLDANVNPRLAVENLLISYPTS